MLGFFALASNVMAKETKYPMCTDKTDWFEKNWCETVEFQKQGWEDGKAQLAKDKETVTTFFNKVISYVTQN